MSFEAVIKLHFPGPGDLISFEELKTGHINRTYVSSWLGKDLTITRFVHQLINSEIFRDIPGLMRNVQLVTATLSVRPDSSVDEKVLEIVPSHAGDSYVFVDGRYWRTYRFIEGTETFEQSPSSEYAGEAGAILGRFQKRLLECDCSQLIDTIPNFHNARSRYNQLHSAIDADPCGRKESVSQDIATAIRFESKANSLIVGLDDGILPRRVTHNDMKLNNVLFKIGHPHACALVDLDTCMPGTSLFDFGDLVRSVAVTSAEDESNLSRVHIDTELLRAVTEGYLKEFGDNLCLGEQELLAQAPQVLAITLGVRFLTDYINGDTYFRIHRPQHNLERARAQFEVAKKLGESQEVISRLV